MVMLIVLMTQPLLQQTNNLLVVMQTMLLVLSFWFALNINSRLIDGVTVLDATPDLADLIGARLAISSETEDGAALSRVINKKPCSG